MRAAKVPLGGYYPADSLVHRLDGGVKFLLVIGLVVTMMLVVSVRAVAFGLLVLIVIAAVSRVPAAAILRGLGPLWFLVIFTFLIHVLSTPAGRALLQVGGISVTSVGLVKGLALSGRLALVVSFSSLLTATTTPSEITFAIQRCLAPLGRLRVPVGDISMMMSIALRFIPTVLTEAENLRMAQEARGLDVKSRNPLRMLRTMAPLVLPLIIGAFRRADELALAMEARGYAHGRVRPESDPLRVAAPELFAIAFCAAAALILLGLGR